MLLDRAFCLALPTKPALAFDLASSALILVKINLF